MIKKEKLTRKWETVLQETKVAQTEGSKGKGTPEVGTQADTQADTQVDTQVGIQVDPQVGIQVDPQEEEGIVAEDQVVIVEVVMEDVEVEVNETRIIDLHQLHLFIDFYFYY